MAEKWVYSEFLGGKYVPVPIDDPRARRPGGGVSLSSVPSLRPYSVQRREIDAFLRSRWYVYALVAPGELTPRYIGSTGSTLYERLQQHKNDRYGSPGKVAWLKSLADAGLEPMIVCLARFQSASDARWCESQLIACLPGLLNVVGRRAGKRRPLI